MKKLTSALLSLVMLVSVLCVPAWAAEQTDCLQATVRVNEEAGTVTVVFEANENTTNGKFTVEFDSQKLDYRRATVNSSISATEATDSSVTLSYATSTADAIKAGKTVATIFFHIVGNWNTTQLNVTVKEFNTHERLNASLPVVTVTHDPYYSSIPITPSTPSTPSTDEEVTTNPDGSTTTTTTDKNGNVTETTETEDGTTSTVVTDEKGNVTEMTAEVSKEAAASGTVTLPLEVETSESAEEAVSVEITVPESVSTVKVEIPVQNVTYSTVVVLVHEDGTEEIISETALTEDGKLAITVDGNVTVKVVDNAQEFVDDDMWAKNEIAFVTSREIFNGIGDNKFDPNSNMTRVQMMTVLARMGGADAYGADWAEKAEQWVKENGVSDGSNPKANITREDLVTMLYNFAGKPATTGSLEGFTDADSISASAVEAMKWAVEMGIINGMGDGTLAPGGEATRAQLAKILTYFINL